MWSFRRPLLVRFAVPLLAATALTGCGNIQNLHSALTPGSSVDDINGKFVDGAQKAKIDYSSQIKARKIIADRANPKESFPGEAHIGLIDHTRFHGDQSVIYDPQVEAFVKDILTKLLANWPNPPPDIRIAFVADKPDDPYEAESGSDGTMYFGMSAIRDVASTDELAFKVAHELAHILMNHTVRVQQEVAGKEMRDTAAGGATLANSAGKTGAAAQSAGNTNRNIALASVGIDLLFEFLNPAFSRQQEREADVLGADLMIRAGYSPRAIEHVMQRLQDQEARVDAALKAVEAEKMAAARRRVAEAHGQKPAPETTPASMPDTPLTGLFDFIDQAHANHPKAEDRRKDIDAYLKREYPTELRTMRKLRVEEYENFKLAVANGPLMRRQFTVMAAEFINKGDLDKAYTFAQRALANAKDPAPEARIQLYQIRKAQADKSNNARWRTEALKHLETAWAGPDATPAVATFLAGEHTAAKRYDQAESILTEASQRFDPALFFALKIGNSVAANRQSQAFATAWQCDQDGIAPNTRSACLGTLPEPWRKDYAAYAAAQKTEQQRQRAKAKLGEGTSIN